jgi:hypothetical protein
MISEDVGEIDPNLDKYCVLNPSFYRSLLAQFHNNCLVLLLHSAMSSIKFKFEKFTCDNDFGL